LLGRKQLFARAIKGPSKEHEHTKADFWGKVIPKKTAKKFPKQDVQPT